MENNLKKSGIIDCKEDNKTRVNMETAYIPKRGRPKRGTVLTDKQKEEQAMYKDQKLKEYMAAYRQNHKEEIKKAMKEYYEVPEVKEKIQSYNRERHRRNRVERKAVENV